MPSEPAVFPVPFPEAARGQAPVRPLRAQERHHHAQAEALHQVRQEGEKAQINKFSNALNWIWQLTMILINLNFEI